MVKIAELKNRLSYYLRKFQGGESILVCDRDRVIARIERVGSDAALAGNDAEWLERLERRGVMRRGAGTLSREWLEQRPSLGADVVAALLREGARDREIPGQLRGRSRLAEGRVDNLVRAWPRICPGR